MTDLRASQSAGRAGARRPGLRAPRSPRWGQALVVAAGAALSLAACSGASAPDVAPHAGQYPVAVPVGAATTVPTAAPGHYQVLPAGEPVDVVLPGGREVVVNVLGPDVTIPSVDGSGASAKVVHGRLDFTVTVRAVHGSLTVPAASFLGLDEKQSPFPITADRPSATASAGHPAQLHLTGRFEVGHTTLTWQPEGAPLVTWDFTVEPD
ncbi:MAG: hypothetical protein ACTHQ3_22270 [Motilibacteraceae bacterium]